MRLELTAWKLAHVARFAAKEDEFARYYLRAVQLERAAAGGMILMATDGATLGCWRDGAAAMTEDWPVEPMAVLLPRCVLAAAGSEDARKVVIEGASVDALMATCFDVTGQPPAGGRCEAVAYFPDWRKRAAAAVACPEGMQNTDEMLNAGLLARFSAEGIGSAPTTTRVRGVHLRFASRDEGAEMQPTRVELADRDFFGLVMPMQWPAGVAEGATLPPAAA